MERLIQLTEEQEMELINKYKEKLICPICQKEKLVHPDYLLNKKFLKGIFYGIITTILGMVIWNLLK